MITILAADLKPKDVMIQGGRPFKVVAVKPKDMFVPEIGTISGLEITYCSVTDPSSKYTTHLTPAAGVEIAGDE